MVAIGFGILSGILALKSHVGPGHRSLAESTTVEPLSSDPLLRVAPLDAARTRPPDPGPKVAGTPGYTTLLVQEYLVKQPTVMEFRVPEQYLGAASGAPANVLGFYFYATFPGLKGPFSREGEGLYNCLGYCSGRMNIYVDNRSHNPLNLERSSGQTRELYRIANPYTPNLYRVFDSGIAGDDSFFFPNGRKYVSRVGFYVKRDKAGRLMAFVKCTDLIPNPTCVEWMSLPGHNDIYVHYTFSMADLPRWPAVHAAVADLVSSFYVKTFPPTVS